MPFVTTSSAIECHTIPTCSYVCEAVSYVDLCLWFTNTKKCLRFVTLAFGLHILNHKKMLRVIKCKYDRISHIHNDATLAVVLAPQGELEGKRPPIVQAFKVRKAFWRCPLVKELCRCCRHTPRSSLFSLPESLCWSSLHHHDWLWSHFIHDPSTKICSALWWLYTIQQATDWVEGGSQNRRSTKNDAARGLPWACPGMNTDQRVHDSIAVNFWSVSC